MTKKFKHNKSGEIYEILDNPIDKNGEEQEGLPQILYRKVGQDQTYLRRPDIFFSCFHELVVDPWHPDYLETVLMTWGNPTKRDSSWFQVVYVSKVQVKDILFAIVVADDDIYTIRFDQIKKLE